MNCADAHLGSVQHITGEWSRQILQEEYCVPLNGRQLQQKRTNLKWPVAIKNKGVHHAMILIRNLTIIVYYVTMNNLTEDKFQKRTVIDEFVVEDLFAAILD